MEMMLGALLLSILFFGLFIFTSKVSYQRRFNSKYSLRAMFPFEINYQSSYRNNVIPNLCLTIFVISSIASAIFYGYNSKNGYIIATMISLCIQFISMMFLFYVSTYHLKVHLLILAMLFVSSFVTSGLEFIYCFDLMKNNIRDPLIVVSSIISILITIFVLGLILNPKLKLTFNYESKTNEKGEEIKIRPKTIVLAFSEWFLFIIPLVNLVAAFLIKLQFYLIGQ